MAVCSDVHLHDMRRGTCRGKNGTCAHEFILDLRKFEQTADIKVIDVAKRLIDYGFHSPTMSWPVTGAQTLNPIQCKPPDLARLSIQSDVLGSCWCARLHLHPVWVRSCRWQGLQQRAKLLGAALSRACGCSWCAAAVLFVVWSLKCGGRRSGTLMIEPTKSELKQELSPP